MRTCFSLSSLARASLVSLALIGAAAHAVEVTVMDDVLHTVNGTTFSLAPGNTSTYEFGANFVSLLQAMGATVTPITGSTATSSAAQLSVSSPIVFVNGDAIHLGQDYFFPKTFISQGGFTIDVGSSVASLGGSVTIDALQVDTIAHTVKARIQGDNGVGNLSGVTLWHYDVPEASGALYQATCTAGSPPTCLAPVAAVHRTGALHLDEQGYNLLSQSLGLTQFGKAGLSSVSNFGAITASVPEPSGWALSLAGMMGLGMLLSRRRATTH